jgi:hypothetical protein
VAATTQVALPAHAASPIALWHLLSLDAPTVAALWVWFIARANHITLPLCAPLAMAITVWMLYVADRLLDSRSLIVPSSETGELEARHFFHHRHRRAFLIVIALAAFAMAALLPAIDTRALRLYLVEGTLLAAWFVVLHATRSAHRLPKEMAVGLFFSAATFVPTVAREPFLRAALLPSAILFAALCSLNCLFIYAWEHETSGPRPAHLTTRLAVARLPALAVGIAVAGAILALIPTPARPIPAACTLSSLLLLILHRNRRQFSRTTLRAAADLALLTPVLLVPFLPSLLQ